jgi:hypothetical protein
MFILFYPIHLIVGIDWGSYNDMAIQSNVGLQVSMNVKNILTID